MLLFKLFVYRKFCIFIYNLVKDLLKKRFHRRNKIIIRYEHRVKIINNDCNNFLYQANNYYIQISETLIKLRLLYYFKINQQLKFSET